MDAAASLQLVYGGNNPLRRNIWWQNTPSSAFGRSADFRYLHQRLLLLPRIRRRNGVVRAITTEPGPADTKGTTSSSQPKFVNNGYGHGYGSSPSSTTSSKKVNGASSRMQDVSQEIKRVRAQMEENEQLAVLMKGLRGQNLNDTLFADDNIKLRLVEVDESSEILPLVYDPASISAYWGKRPRPVATRIVQLLSVAGGFLSRIIWDIINKKVKEVPGI